jgi:hypothetical protein
MAVGIRIQPEQVHGIYAGRERKVETSKMAENPGE